MRAVLYTHDMEPITVLELQPWAVEYLTKRGIVSMAVTRPLSYTLPIRGLPHLPEECVWRVDITAEYFARNGRRHLFLFTHQEEHALLLRSAFLPGQRSALRDRDKEAFGKGFMAALDMLGR